ncbi:hypothetical protein NPIL_245611 [Nephila pilipes]|uniref:Uncharacterized protein n=1 Tax=Nephila pilipes TaxID=299642 RepID=A0A8X6Q7A6_NEPPI|nr:hypothetical protein NPIL_245611 [Nephila pilipes]
MLLFNKENLNSYDKYSNVIDWTTGNLILWSLFREFVVRFSSPALSFEDLHTMQNYSLVFVCILSLICIATCATDETPKKEGSQPDVPKQPVSDQKNSEKGKEKGANRQGRKDDWNDLKGVWGK